MPGHGQDFLNARIVQDTPVVIQDKGIVQGIAINQAGQKDKTDERQPAPQSGSDTVLAYGHSRPPKHSGS